MGNKPHRIKKLQQKALRKAYKDNTSKESSATKKTYSNLFHLKPFNANIAKEMLSVWKKEVEHIHLKNKPHHHKRTTPGSVDADAPKTISGHGINDKSMKTWHKGDTQKSADIGRKLLRNSYKKAA